MNDPRRIPVGACSALALVALLSACLDSPTTFEPAAPTFARGKPSPELTVTGVDPDKAPQDTTLDVQVSGDGWFDDGSKVTFKMGRNADGSIVTNRTTFVSPQVLVANITIAVDADTGAYDVEVTTLGGRRGVGTEMFQVMLRNSPYVELSNWTGAVWAPSGVLRGEFMANIGHLWLDTQPGPGPRKKTPPPVELCVDLSHPVGEKHEDNYNLFEQLVEADPTSTGMDSVCTLVTLHTRSHSNQGGMADQEEGRIEHSGGKIVLHDFNTGTGGGWEWRLVWDVEGSSPLPQGDGVCIDHPNWLTWYVYNDDDLSADPAAGGCEAGGVAIDNVARLIRVYSDQFVLVAEFLLPFRFTVTRVAR